MEIELIYLAFRKGELFAFSFCIEEFFSYLQNFYLIHGNSEITIRREVFQKEVTKIPILNPEFEILTFYPEIFMTGVETNYWESYFRGFYAEIERVNEDLVHDSPVQTYEDFLDYLGEEKIRKIVNGVDYETLKREFDIRHEFSTIINDK